jgi:exodeoxyribonuclease V alpha subunit
VAEAIRLEGKVDKIRFSRDGFQIVLIKASGGGPRKGLVTIKGTFPAVAEGETIAVLGQFEDDDRYGEYFGVKEFAGHVLKTKPQLAAYFAGDRFKGLDKELGKRAVEHFGVDIFDILDADVNRISEVSGVGPKLAERFIASYQTGRTEMKRLADLLALGLTDSEARAALEQFGNDAHVIVKAEPYCLIKIEGIGFRKADVIAIRMGMAVDDPRRVKAVLEYCADNAQSMGHCFLEYFDLCRQVDKLTNDSIRRSLLTAAMDALVKDGVLIREGTRVYHTDLYHCEKAVAAKLKELLTYPKLPIYSCEEDLLYDLEQTGALGGITLAPNQLKGLMFAMNSRVSIITGGPGTGKTTITKALCALLQKCHLDLTLCAPTGRAAKRMTEATGRPAMTIHRTLKWSPKMRALFYNQANPLPTDVVICDESSMVDIKLMRNLLDAMNPDDRLVLIGDVDQLPSVGPGNVLRDLIACKLVPTVKLDRVYRQAAGSFILDVAYDVINGRVPRIPPPTQMGGKNVGFIACSDANQIHDLMAKVVTVKLPQKGIPIDKIQVLSPKRVDALGVEALNPTLQEAINPKHPAKGEIQNGGFVLREGDRVLQIKNNYLICDEGVFNGDLGVAKTIAGKEAHVKFPDLPDEVAYNEKLLPQLQLAYAMSVHKCLPIDEQVTTSGGARPLAEISIGETVHTGQGDSRPVANTFDVGEKSEWRLHTKSGYELRGAGEHPVLVFRGDGYLFVRIDELRMSDYICIDRTVVAGNEGSIQTPALHEFGRIRPTIPPLVSADLAWLMGVLTGDGCLTDKSADAQVEVSCGDRDLADEVARIVSSYGIHVGRNDVPNKAMERVWWNNQAFRTFLYELGIGFELAAKKSVPPQVFCWPQKLREAFLAGYGDADGSAGIGECRLIRYRTASPALALGIQRLLLLSGVISVRKMERARSWLISVGGPSLKLLTQGIPFRLKRKMDRALLIVAKQKTGRSTNDRIPKALSGSIVSTFKTTIGSSKGKKGQGLYANQNRSLGSLLQQVERSPAKLNYARLAQMRDYLVNSNRAVPAVLDDIIGLNYYYDQVHLVEKTGRVVPMRDIEIAGKHSFTAGGFVCHNSQGGEFDAVVIILHPSHTVMLQRNLLYTAITRAKKVCIIIGTHEALVSAVQNSHEMRRNTSLQERLQAEMYGVVIKAA